MYEFSYGNSSSQNTGSNSSTYMEIRKNGAVLDYGKRSVTFPSDINTSGTYTLNLGEDDSSLDRSFEGSIAEIIIFDRDLDSEETAKINRYLANKWDLDVKIDSDDDGIIDKFDIYPNDQ